MENRKEKLIEVMGWGEKTARVYLGLLDSGETTVTDLAKKCALKRTTVYNILPELQQQGLVGVTKRAGKRLFFIDDTRDLERVVEEKISGIKKLLPELTSHHNIISSKPHITLYEGIGGMKQLYQKIIDDVSPGDIILTYIGMYNFEELLPQDMVNKYVEERIKKRIRNRMIVSSGPPNNKWVESASQELREIKIIKDAKEKFSADMKIYAGKVAFLSYQENFFGLVIESREISTLLKTAFELMWQAS